jgi:hypothetical protein
VMKYIRRQRSKPVDECNRDLYVNNQESPLLLFLFCEVFFIHD